MRNRNSRAHKSDSLDLLLDTICNTFGGIVFISLLVVILANMTGKDAAVQPPDQASQSRLVALRRELEAERDRLQRTQSVLRQQQLIKGEFTSRESVRLARELGMQRIQVSTLVGNNDSVLARVAELQAQNNTIAKELADQRTAITATAKQLQTISRRLTREVSRRTRDVTLPTVSRWNGDVANTVLKNGTLCFLQIPSNGFLAWNPRESKIAKEMGETIIDPVISAGLKINLTSPADSALNDKLSTFDSRKHLIRVWVMPDSYGEFTAVREALVRNKFRYEIRPLPQTGRLHLGGSETQTRAQ